MTQPLHHSDLLFPHQTNTPTISSTLTLLRRTALSLPNRLISISLDSAFVATVSSAYSLPLVANERCGSWYIAPAQKHSSVYFKSTDGHMGQWGFSLRRLNLQVLDVVEMMGGCVIVDSTRRGKSMPDALSKTVPLWCCVMNRAVLGEKAHALYTPPLAVGESEHAQMEARVDGFVRQFLEICRPNIVALRAKMTKPLRPIWVTRESTLPDSVPDFPDFHPIVLCTASRRVRGAEASENGYIQGAADDQEAWARGMTPQLFWAHQARLLSTNEEDMDDVIEELKGLEKQGEAVATLIKPTTSLFVSSSENVDLGPFDAVVSCTTEPIGPSVLRGAGVKRYLHLKCQTGKLGSRDLRLQLPKLRNWRSELTDPGKVLVCCPTGKDVSVGTALALLCLFVDGEGTVNMVQPREARSIDKTFIKQRLSWITTSNPALNPSRATLQSVNTMLMSGDSVGVDEGWQMVQQSGEIGENGDGKNEDPSELDVASSIFPHLATPEGESWRFTRKLNSVLSTHPSGTVTGTATFERCTYANEPTNSSTMVYSEEGEFVTDNGLRFTARRRYVYQLRDDSEGQGRNIAVFFYNDEKMTRGQGDGGVGASGEGIGGLFVETGEFCLLGDAYEAKNRETHLCGGDLYNASWKFSSAVGKPDRGNPWWEVRYDVKGPKKDYTSETRYEKM